VRPKSPNWIQKAANSHRLADTTFIFLVDISREFKRNQRRRISCDNRSAEFLLPTVFYIRLHGVSFVPWLCRISRCFTLDQKEVSKPSLLRSSIEMN
jgi:hypothetical protein